MKRQKRGKCKLWRSFTNIFRRKRSADDTEAPLPPFAVVSNVCPPLNTAVEEKIQPSKPVESSKRPVSPVKEKRPQKPVEQRFPGDLDAVGREVGLVNTDIAKDRIRIKPDNRRAPAKYNQKQGFDSESPDRSLEDFAAVRSESQDESLNSKDENSAVMHDSAPGELSSGSDTAERSARTALLPTKVLPKTPDKRQKYEEPEEQAEFKRIPSKKKLAGSSSDEAKRLQTNSNAIVKPVDPVNLPISESRINAIDGETGAKAVKGATKATEMRQGPKQADSKIRHSVSMHEAKRLTVKADDVIGENRSKDSAVEGAKLSVESAKLSSSAKERKLASKTESLDEAQATKSSTLEVKSKAGKQEVALPLQGSLQKLSKTVKTTHDEIGGEKIEGSPPLEDSNMEKSLKRPQRRDSKLKVDGKGVDAAIGARSSYKRNSSRRNSARKSGRLSQESHDESTAKNSVQEDSKKTAEDKIKVPIIVTPPVADLLEGKELLTGKVSGEREEAQKVVDQSSSALQDLDKGSNMVEGRGIDDDRAAEPVSVAGGLEKLTGKGGEDMHEGENKANQGVKRNASSRKADFVMPAVPAKALQKGKDIRNGIQKDAQAVASTDTEIKKLLPAAEAATDDAQKRRSRLPEEDGMKEFNKVLQKIQNKPGNDSTTTSTEASPPLTKTDSKGDAVVVPATENGSAKHVRCNPVPPKAFPKDLGGSQKAVPGDAKIASSTNLSASVTSNRNSHSRAPSVMAGESKAQSEGTEAEKPKGDVVGSSSVKTKGPPPVVNRSGKVQPKAVENAKDPDNAWIGKAKRMSKDFSEKMLQIETKTEEIKTDGEVKIDDNFERGGETRASVKDMIKKLQKQNQAS